MRLDLLLNVTRAEAIRKIQSLREIPLTVKLGIVAGLGLISDDDYAKYLRLLLAATQALAQTPDGQAVLNEIGLTAPAAVADPAG